MPRHCPTLLTLTFTLLCLLSQLVDITLAQHWMLVDDNDSEINYTGSWKEGPCGTCVSPNLTGVHNETWHETTPSRSSGDTRVTFQFTGYAVLFGVLLDDKDADMHTSVRITLDDTALDYYRDSANNGNIQTGAIIYYKDQLAFTQHTLTIDVNANSIFMLDYIAYQDSLTNTPDTPTSGPTSASPSTTPAPSGTQAVSSATGAQSTTSKIVSVGPSGTTTLLTTLPVTAINGLNLNSLTRATTSFDISTFSLSNMQEFTVQVSTSTDSAGHTLLVPVVTVTDPSYGATHTGNHSGTASSSDNSFSPALAGAIGAAVAAVSAVLIVVFMFCMRRRRGVRARPGSAEPYILANSTPSSQNSNLTPRLSPYQESALGLFTMPQGMPDYRTQPDFLLSSPPPNHSLMSPISPNQHYYPPQNITVTTTSSEQHLNPHSNSNSLTTPISPNHPQPYYLHGQPHPNQPYPNQSYPNQPYYTYATQEKLSRQASNNYLSAQRRQSGMAELRSPVTPLIPRPADWNIESQSETGVQQTAAAPPPQSPAMLLPSPAIITPSPHSSRRRSGRQKEIMDEDSMPPPVPQIPGTLSNVPILGHPSALRRGRRRTDGAERLPRREDGGIRSSEDSIAPVVRRQSFSHPAPPAYSPPRLVRNRDLHDVLLD